MVEVELDLLGTPTAEGYKWKILVYDFNDFLDRFCIQIKRVFNRRIPPPTGRVNMPGMFELV